MERIKIVSILSILFITIASFTASAFSLYFSDKSVSHGVLAESYTAYLDARVPALMKRYQIPGANIALVKGGKIIWVQSYGYADVKTGRPMTSDTPMRVQSISKPVTAWAVMKLATEGKINIDNPAAQYLKHWKFPESEFPSDRITVRQLLSHTAGMPLGDVFTLYSPGKPIPSLRESLTHSAVPVKNSGSGFSYSNVGYNILELLIEEVSGQNFAEYMKNEILLPLGMTHSSFLWRETMSPQVPVGYTLSGKAVPLYVYPEKASGGLFATAEDIAAFAVAGMPAFSRQDVLPGSAVARLYEAQAEKLGVYSLVFDAYGLGYYTERLSSGERAVSHGGQGTGWMSHFHAIPGTGDAIVILSNSQRSWPFIAGLLNSWARWCGFSPPKMTRILLGECILWALAGLLLSTAVFQGAAIVRSAACGRLRWMPPNFCRAGLPRLIKLVSSLIILAGLAWCACQKYLFLSSVFPTASSGVGICAAVFAGVLFMLSFLL